MPQQTTDDNIEALKRLRALPRGTQVESRIAAIQNMLGEQEIFKTLKMLRWPEGIVCPRCHSNNVVRRQPPINAIDLRHYYECLNCKGRGGESIFDDLTEISINTLHALRQSILCWYLIGFCSMAQIAKVMGISMSEVAQLAHFGSDLAQLPDKDQNLSNELTQKSKRSGEDSKRSEVEQREDHTRSASKSPFKPGFKSKF